MSSCNEGTIYMCQFSNVYVDIARVYFIPKLSNPISAINAAIDLYDCCMDTSQGQNRYKNNILCKGSVDWNLCLCFHNSVTLPAVWSQKQRTNVREPIRLMEGNTWLMNHFVASHHPDHFNMKLLEFHNLAFMSVHNTSSCYKSFPNKIDSLLSMDYPSHTLDDYEKFIMRIVDKGVHGILPISSLNNGNGYNNLNYKYYWTHWNVTIFEPFCSLLHASFVFQTGITTSHQKTYKMLQNICSRMKFDSTKIMRIGGGVMSDTAYLKQAFFSPYYQNNIPPPVESSMAALRHSINAVLSNTSEIDAHCAKRNNSRANLHVAILQRVDGNGLRRFINFDETIRLVRQVMKVDDVSVWYFSSHTPPLQQATSFCNVHLIVAPHTSQLSNLIFAAPRTSLIELQPMMPIFDTSFKDLAERAGIHYQVVGNSAAMSNWRRQDIIVDLSALEIALKNAYRNLVKEGYLFDNEENV